MQQLFTRALDEEAKFMMGLIDFLERDENLRNAWIARDRTALLSHVQPLFKDIRTKYQVTHFYFIGLDKVSFLRVYNPERYGDIIRHLTLDRAVREGAPVHGIELGKFGTFTLRVVHPWYIDGKLAGYIELGREIEHITPRLKEIIDVELLFAINKSFLNRSRWEEGLKIMGRTGDWDQFSEIVVIDRTMDEIPPRLGEYMDLADGKDLLFNASTDDRKYHGGFVPLIDTSGRTVGKIAVMRDVTEEKTSLRTLSATLIGISAVIGIALFGLFYLYIGRIEGRLVGAREELTDEIEERKQVENALRESETRFRSVAQSANDAIVSSDSAGQVVFWNQAAQEMFGYTEDEIFGQPLTVLMSERYAGPHARAMELLVSNGETPAVGRTILVHGLRKDGSEFPLEFSLASWNAGEEVFFTGIIRDISERVLLQEQLQHAQKMQAVGTLASGVAHEFNNILMTIQGKTQLLSIGIEPGNPLARYLRDIEAGCQRAAELTAKMLSFAQLDVREKRPVHVNRAAERVKQILRQTLPSHSKLEFELQEGLPSVLAGAAQLDQVLLILGSNANEAMPRGGRIRFGACMVELDEAFRRTHPWAKNGRYVELVVEDTGAGMTPEVLERAFEPFFTTKGLSKGPGLGLSIAYSIVKNLGGGILAESQVGHGSRFWVYLPAIEEEQEQA
jgi:PAS domain S-box-containing protein